IDSNGTASTRIYELIEPTYNDFENKIDHIVYHLYNLTYDEVLIVDPQTPITREEYDNFKIED
ncbi:MAG: hypothetical protein MJ236_05495, partial [Clostridia bacterium]|nr:hypothetical protein [Clostridia bacterium]